MSGNIIGKDIVSQVPQPLSIGSTGALVTVDEHIALG